MIMDDAVRTHIYKREETFFLPLSFLKQVAARCKGELLLKEDWSQVLFLCRDTIGLSFWIKRGDEKPLHTIVSMEVGSLAAAMPELVDLWLWKHVEETWDEVRANFVGNNNVSEYARGLARTYPHCVALPSSGLN